MTIENLTEIVTALEAALEAGDKAKAAELAVQIEAPLDIKTKRTGRCETCGIRYVWPGRKSTPVLNDARCPKCGSGLILTQFRAKSWPVVEVATLPQFPVAFEAGATAVVTEEFKVYDGWDTEARKLRYITYPAGTRVTVLKLVTAGINTTTVTIEGRDTTVQVSNLEPVPAD